MANSCSVTSFEPARCVLAKDVPLLQESRADADAEFLHARSRRKVRGDRRRSSAAVRPSSRDTSRSVFEEPPEASCLDFSVFELKRTISRIDFHSLAFADFAFEDVDRERVENFFLNGAAKRARAVDRIVTFAREMCFR